MKKSRPAQKRRHAANEDAPTTSKTRELKKQKSANNNNRLPPVASDEPWVTSFAPSSREHLAVHSRKVDDVKNWIQTHLGQAVFLLLTGPAGAGKTATVRAVCAEIGCEILEWTNPNRVEVSTEQNEDSGQPMDVVRPVAQGTQFMEFLLEAGYRSLNPHVSTQKILLVEDFPNTLYRTPKYLHNDLQVYQRRGLHPIVFIVSDAPSASDLSSFHLFPPNIISQLQIQTIKFNLVADSIMKKALERIVKHQAQFLTSSPHFKALLANLVSRAQGDIRAGINDLQMCLSLEKCPKQMVKQLADKDTSLDFFHALGKLCYAKRCPTVERKGELNVPELLRRKFDLEFDIEQVLEQSHIEPDKMAAFIHENCISFLPDIEHLQRVSEDFSFVDSISSWWQPADAKSQYTALVPAMSHTFNNCNHSTGQPFARKHKGLHKFRRNRILQAVRERQQIEKNCLSAFLESRMQFSPDVLLLEILPLASRLRQLPQFQQEPLNSLTDFPHTRQRIASSSLVPSDLKEVEENTESSKKESQTEDERASSAYANDIEIDEYPCDPL